MKPTVYLETTILGYLSSRPSRDLVTAANQQMTHEWWDGHRERFDLYVSPFVIEECSAGDAQAANQRLAVLEGISQLNATEGAERLANELVKQVPLPEKAAVDALHIAIAAVHGMTYLLTWNCTHIANPALRPRIEMICRSLGYEPPAICTPQELMEV